MAKSKHWYVYYGVYTSLGAFRRKKDALEYIEKCRKDPDLLRYAADREENLDKKLWMGQYSEDELG